jgi:hypothetical protein
MRHRLHSQFEGDSAAVAACTVTTLDAAAELLGVDPAGLSQLLVSNTFTTSYDKVRRSVNATQVRQGPLAYCCNL